MVSISFCPLVGLCSLSGDLHHLLALTIDLSGLGLEELEENPLVFQCVHMQ